MVFCDFITLNVGLSVQDIYNFYKPYSSLKFILFRGLEILSSTLSFVKDKLRIYSYVTLMIIIQSVYLFPKEIRLCV